jgi:hypothetical protein
MNSDIKKTDYIKAGPYYLEMNKIQIREMSNIPFFGGSLRRYDQYKHDFINVASCDENRIYREFFLPYIIEFCDKNEIDDRHFKFMGGL